MYERKPIRIRRLDGNRTKRRAGRGPRASGRKHSRHWSANTRRPYRVAFSILRNPSDAEDAVRQEAFLRVLRHRDTLGEIRDHRVWLIRIVWNIVLDRKRRAKTRPETDDVAELARVLPAHGLTPNSAPRLRNTTRMC